MNDRASEEAGVGALWERARSGDLRGGSEAAREALAQCEPQLAPATRVDLHLVAAFCAMRQGQHAEALRELAAADAAAKHASLDAQLSLRIDTW
ncbi:MAG TPA: hypothetical protein VMU96_08255, partial [Casimicrobiaceae bacterium]|nr:hypothetical protein [Casimicrobiaceae bacterium]